MSQRDWPPVLNLIAENPSISTIHLKMAMPRAYWALMSIESLGLATCADHHWTITQAGRDFISSGRKE